MGEKYSLNNKDTTSPTQKLISFTNHNQQQYILLSLLKIKPPNSCLSATQAPRLKDSSSTSVIGCSPIISENPI